MKEILETYKEKEIKVKDKINGGSKEIKIDKLVSICFRLTECREFKIICVI